MINDRPVEKPAEARRAVNLPAPFGRSGGTEEHEMFEPKQRFGFAVTLLLFQERFERESPIMPHNCCRTEADDAAGLLKSPTEINVISGFAIFDIETADAFE